MIYRHNETVSAKALSDLREAVGWNRMESEYENPLMTSYCILNKTETPHSGSQSTYAQAPVHSSSPDSAAL